jgi:hypothetical protein
LQLQSFYVLILFRQGCRITGPGQWPRGVEAFRKRFSVAPDRSHLKIVHVLAPGKFPDERVALSLVHPRGRIDVPVGVIRGIEAREEQVFATQTGPIRLARPHVEIRFTPAVSSRLYELTRQIVGQPLEIVVGGKTITKPIVREPLGGRRGRIAISTFNFDEARALAERLRERWSRVGLRLVRRRNA